MHQLAFWVSVSLCFGTFVQADYSTQCNMCMNIAQNSKAQGTETQAQTQSRVLSGAANSGYDPKLYSNEVLCHWKKYYYDANNNTKTSLLQTCADLGNCPSQYQTPFPFGSPFIDITNGTKSNQYTANTCFVPQVILIHHTVTKTAEETIEVLNQRNLSVQYIVAKNGTIYQQVYDFNAAYHAGLGNFRNISNGRNMNYNCVGIEIVNSGAEPFPDVQMKAVMELVGFLKTKWYVDYHDIIGHYDIAPDRKDDPSGYFKWKQLYDYLGVFPGLFDSKLSNQSMHIVLMDNTDFTTSEVSQVSRSLMSYGYMYLPGSTTFDNNFALNVQAFNRHFCPEIYIQEVVVNDDTVPNPLNQRWYQISDERLKKLLLLY